MEDLCVGGGMNRFSFHAFVSWSPVIAQFGHSIYGLLGAAVSREQVQELLAKRRASRANHRVLDRHGWTDDGRVWLSYRLSKGGHTYAVHHHSRGALREVVNGRFQFVDADGRPIGTIWPPKDAAAWGLAPSPPQKSRTPNRRSHRADARPEEADGRGGVGTSARRR